MTGAQQSRAKEQNGSNKYKKTRASSAEQNRENQAGAAPPGTPRPGQAAARAKHDRQHPKQQDKAQPKTLVVHHRRQSSRWADHNTGRPMSSRRQVAGADVALGFRLAFPVKVTALSLLGVGLDAWPSQRPSQRPG